MKKENMIVEEKDVTSHSTIDVADAIDLVGLFAQGVSLLFSGIKALLHAFSN